MTRRDLVDGNRDLLNFCGRQLAGQPRTQLVVAASEAGDGVQITTTGLDRLDLFVDNRPFSSQPITDGTTTVELTDGWSVVEAAAYRDDTIRQRRRLPRP
jgi:hypothetical protein